ncbi:hypothetical protein C0992_012793 [Termitomyces sp. T32_za158]|nr:hypothetical protein C0992_012793 [Termitomyces sp. T32_za158]
MNVALAKSSCDFCSLQGYTQANCFKYKAAQQQAKQQTTSHKEKGKKRQEQANAFNDDKSKKDDAEFAGNANLEKKDKPLTKAAITNIICAVAKWRDTSELFSTPENTATAMEMLVQLQTVIAGLGVDVARRIKCKDK